MYIDDIINEHGIELARDKIAVLISDKLDEYKKTRNKDIQKELSGLLEDRDKIYNNDKETIKKYLM